MPQLEMAAEPALRWVKKLLKRVGQEPRLLAPDTEEALDGELQSSLTACRHQALAAVSPPSGASQNAWVCICPQTTNQMYQLIGMHRR
jgi:hypothetical protein